MYLKKNVKQRNRRKQTKNKRNRKGWKQLDEAIRWHTEENIDFILQTKDLNETRHVKRKNKSYATKNKVWKLCKKETKRKSQKKTINKKRRSEIDPLNKVKGRGNKTKRTSEHRGRSVNIGEGDQRLFREFDKGFDVLMAASVVRETCDQEAQEGNSFWRGSKLPDRGSRVWKGSAKAVSGIRSLSSVVKGATWSVDLLWMSLLRVWRMCWWKAVNE